MRAAGALVLGVDEIPGAVLVPVVRAAERAGLGTVPPPLALEEEVPS